LHFSVVRLAFGDTTQAKRLVANINARFLVFTVGAILAVSKAGIPLFYGRTTICPVVVWVYPARFNTDITRYDFIRRNPIAT
jgi:hypothetical protein